MPSGFCTPCLGAGLRPPAGEGNVTVTYQNSLGHGHLDLNGKRMPGPSCCDPVRVHAIEWELEYGLRDRLALNVSLPFITSKYGGPFPHPLDLAGHPSAEDDGSYHGTFQDFAVGLRFNVKARPVSITPSIELIVPSHHYPSLAHSAPGKDLRALVVGGAVGGFLDRVPGLFFQAQMSYAEVQEIVGIRPNRSRVNAEIGYFITPRLAIRILGSYQVTHNGLDSILFAGPNSVARIHRHPEIPYTSEYRLNHDRLQRNNFLNVGGGIGLAVNDDLEIFAAGANTVWGENIHPLRGFTFGMNMHLRIHPNHQPISPRQAQRAIIPDS